MSDPVSGPEDTSVSGARIIQVAATTPSDRRRVLLEVSRRAWVAEHGILSGPVVHCATDGSSASFERVSSLPRCGSDYVHAVLDIAARIAGLPQPIPMVASSTTWRAPTLTRVLRVPVLLLGGIRLGEWRADRQRVRELPATTVAHGDLWHKNIYRVGERQIAVMDWEYATLANSYRDPARFLTSLLDATDALEGIRRLREEAAPNQVAALAACLRLEAHLMVAHCVVARPHPDPHGDLELWRRRLRWTRSIVADLSAGRPLTSQF